MINCHLNTTVKSKDKVNLLSETNQANINNQNHVNLHFNKSLKKSSINFGIPQTPHPKTPMSTNQNLNQNSFLTFTHHRPSKIQNLSKQLLFEKSIQQINEKITQMALKISTHDIQILKLSRKNSKQNYQLDLYEEDKTSHKEISYPEQMPILIFNCQKQIVNLKKEILTSLSKNNLNNLLSDNLKQINNIITPLNALLKQQIQTLSNQVKSSIQNQTKNIRKQLLTIIEQNNKKVNNLIGQFQAQLKTNNIISIIQQKKSKILATSPLNVVKYLQYFQVNTLQSNRFNLLLNQIVFKMDSQGYLLDQQGYYLLDSTNSSIKLNEHHILTLKNNNILR